MSSITSVYCGFKSGFPTLREYSSEWHEGIEPFYTVNDEKNTQIYLKYKALADMEEKVLFGGRLAEYKYYDMAPVIERAMQVYNAKP